jgi:hypothetical protein
MFCPQCGQEKASDETIYCSRCGLPLTLASDLIAHGGYLPQLAQLEKQSASIYTRKNGALFSVFWLLFGLLMAIIFGGVFRINVLGELFAVVGIFGGLLMLLFSLFFLNKSPKAGEDPYRFSQPAGISGRSHPALPPQKTMPADVYVQPRGGAWRDTKDLQPSVTENTTKLLDEDETLQ